MTTQATSCSQPDQRQHVQPDRDGSAAASSACRRGWPAMTPCRMTQNRSSGDPDLADQDDHGHPPGQLAQQRQADQRRADQRLVGDRVGQLAELGDQVAPAGEFAVEPVGDRRDREDRAAQRSATPVSCRRRGTAPPRTPARAAAAARSARWRCSTPTPALGGSAIGSSGRATRLDAAPVRRRSPPDCPRLGDEVDAVACRLTTTPATSRTRAQPGGRSAG